MPREQYQERLGELRQRVLEMAELVVERLRTALGTFESRDEEAARSVIDGDEEINERYLDLEADCVQLLALQQPVAGDLRFITASFKIITDLERIGDLATNLAEYATETDRTYSDVDVREIGALTAEMLEDAIDAYAGEVADATFEIARRDDEIDAYCQQAGEVVIRDLIDGEIGDSSDEEIRALLDDVSRTLLTIRESRAGRRSRRQHRRPNPLHGRKRRRADLLK